jgi:hypothetical protein
VPGVLGQVLNATSFIGNGAATGTPLDSLLPSLSALPIGTGTLSNVANTASALVPAVLGQVLNDPSLLGNGGTGTPLDSLLPSLSALPVGTGTLSNVTHKVSALAPAVVGRVLNTPSLLGNGATSIPSLGTLLPSLPTLPMCPSDILNTAGALVQAALGQILNVPSLLGNGATSIPSLPSLPTLPICPSNIVNTASALVPAILAPVLGATQLGSEL